jgi:hypothetical protein
LGQVQSRRFAHRAWGEAPDLEEFWTEVAHQMLLAWRLPQVHLAVLALALLGAWSLRKRRVLIVALLILSLSAPGMVGLVSTVKPMFRPRIMLWGGPAFFVLAGLGVSALRKAWLQVGAMALLAFVCLRGLERWYYDKAIKTGWRDVAEELNRHVDDETRILFHSFREERPIGYYAERDTRRMELPQLLRLDKGRARRQSPRKILHGAKDVFYVHGVRAGDAPPLVEFVAAHAERISLTTYDGAVLEHYRLP